MFCILHKLLLLFILSLVSFSSYGNDRKKCEENFTPQDGIAQPKNSLPINKSEQNHLTLTIG